VDQAVITAGQARVFPQVANASNFDLLRHEEVVEAIVGLAAPVSDGQWTV
jgi:hypothetical protein